MCGCASIQCRQSTTFHIDRLVQDRPSTTRILYQECLRCTASARLPSDANEGVDHPRFRRWPTEETSSCSHSSQGWGRWDTNSAASGNNRGTLCCCRTDTGRSVGPECMTPSEAFGLAFPDQAHWGLDTNVRICTGIHCWNQLDLNRAGWVRLLSILICFLLSIRQGQQLRPQCSTLWKPC